jgi:hypothetical protein
LSELVDANTNAYKGAVQFNLQYPPFGLDDSAWAKADYTNFQTPFTSAPAAPLWVLRNGFNNDPQDAATNFGANFNSYAASSGPDGNGAVKYMVTAHADNTLFDVTNAEKSVYIETASAAGSTALERALKTLNDMGATKLSGRIYEVQLAGTYAVPPQSFSSLYPNIKGAVTVTLVSSTSATVTYKSGTTGSLFTLNNAGLNFQIGGGVTLQGISANSVAMILVSAGTFTLNGGTVTGNTNVSTTSADLTYGAGVCVGGSGTFNLKSGTLSNNVSTQKSIGGVYVTTGGTLNMSGGSITGNKTGSGNGGGIEVWDTANFTMTGGTISGNSSTLGGGGVYLSGTGKHTISGGVISGNKTSNYGGGIYSDTTLTVSGGTVSGNTVSNPNGGPCQGAGIYSKSTLNVTGGTISDNSGGDGAGIYVLAGTLTVSGGTISGNSGGDGGGITIAASAKLNISGGVVCGNSATDAGGGVAVFSGGATCSMSGGLIVGSSGFTDTAGKYGPKGTVYPPNTCVNENLVSLWGTLNAASGHYFLLDNTGSHQTSINNSKQTIAGY